MHYLDSVIEDIEPRMQAIMKETPTMGDSSIQSSLMSYGWVLLDSWIAWRTLRFILRSSNIDECIPEKWIRTPSSYRYNQLQPIWNFSKECLDYFEKMTDHSLKDAIDNTIQNKRNASAHFSRDPNLRADGMDVRLIKKYYDILSWIFRFRETEQFLFDLGMEFEKIGIADFSYSFYGCEVHDNTFKTYQELKKIVCSISIPNTLYIVFDKENKECGTAFGLEEVIDKIKLEDGKNFNIFDGKCYYVNKQPIISAVVQKRNQVSSLYQI